MNVEWKVEASNDLDRVADYITKNRPGHEAAVLQEILDAVELVTTHPHSGRPGRVKGTREWVAVYPWVIVYTVDDEALVVVRVLHGKQKWP